MADIIDVSKNFKPNGDTRKSIDISQSFVPSEEFAKEIKAAQSTPASADLNLDGKTDIKDFVRAKKQIAASKVYEYNINSINIADRAIVKSAARKAGQNRLLDLTVKEKETLTKLADEMKRTYGKGSLSEYTGKADIDMYDALWWLTGAYQFTGSQSQMLYQGNKSDKLNRKRLEYAALSSDDFEEKVKLGENYTAGESSSASKAGSFTERFMSDYNTGGKLPDYSQRVRNGSDNYKYMTDNEKSVYFYLLGSGRVESANSYLEAIKSDLESRKAQKEADNNSFLQNLGDAILTGYSTGARNTARSLSGLKAATGQPLSELDKITFDTTYEEKLWSEIQANSDNRTAVGNIILETVSSVASQVPAMLVGAAGGNVGYFITMSANIIGGNTTEAVDSGYEAQQGFIHGIIESALEIGVEKVLGGFSSLLKGGKTSSLVKTTIGAVDKAVKNKFVADMLAKTVTALGQMGSEGVEEFLQELTEPLIRNVIYGENNGYNSETFENAVHAFIVGALSGGLMSIPYIGGNVLETRAEITGEHIKAAGGVKSVLALAEVAGNDSVLFEKIKEDFRNGNDADAADIAALYRQSFDMFKNPDSETAKAFVERNVDAVVAEAKKRQKKETSQTTDTNSPGATPKSENANASSDVNISQNNIGVNNNIPVTAPYNFQNQELQSSANGGIIDQGGDENVISDQGTTATDTSKSSTAYSGGAGIHENSRKATEKFNFGGTQSHSSQAGQRLTVNHGKTSSVSYTAASPNSGNGYKAYVAFKSSGVNAVYCDGVIERTENGKTVLRTQAFTAPDGTVYISNRATIPDKEIYDHERVHVADFTDTVAYYEYESALYDNADWLSNGYRRLAERINKEQFNNKYDINAVESYYIFMREIAAYINQFVLSNPEYAQKLFGGMFTDWSAVVAAVEKFNKDMGADFNKSASFLRENSEMSQSEHNLQAVLSTVSPNRRTANQNRELQSSANGGIITAENNDAEITGDDFNERLYNQGTMGGSVERYETADTRTKSEIIRFRQEDEVTFQRRIKEAFGGHERSLVIGKTTLAFRKTSPDNSEAGKAYSLLKSADVKVVFCQGSIYRNNGKTTVESSQAVTAPDGTVYISSRNSLSGTETAYHELVHVAQNTDNAAFSEYEFVINNNINRISDEYLRIAEMINQNNFGGALDTENENSGTRIMRELSAYINQYVMTDPEYAEQTFGGMFTDWSAVVAAVEKFNKDMGADFNKSASFLPENSSQGGFEGNTANFSAETENAEQGEAAAAEEGLSDNFATFGGIDTLKGKHLDKAQQDEIRSVGEKLGRTVIYEDFYALDKFKSKKRIPDGYIDKDGNIHINFYAKRPIYFIFKHEITHYLKRALPAYTDFMNMVFDSKAFSVWLHNKGFSSIDGLKAEILDTYSEVKGFDETHCYDEILADFVGSRLFGGERAINAEFMNALKPKQKKTFFDILKSIIEFFKSKFSDESKVNLEISRIEKEFIKVYNEAVKAKTEESSDIDGEQYSFTGYAEDGKGKYKSNFPKGTPKSAKGERILRYIQDVWSKKPIRLKITENGDVHYIEANFDPTYDETKNVFNDATKLMGGNRHGTSSEQRVTLDLADDYYQIATESKYNYSKDETGKDNPTHKDVKKWHYFVNDIYFAEYDSEEYVPYRVSINVKERSDGNYVYSFSAEKQRESGTPRTLHAVVNEGENSNANAKLSDNRVTQKPPIVNTNSMQKTDEYSIPSQTSAEILLDRYEIGEITRDEYLSLLRKEKTLHPLEIANLTEKDANTTPPLERRKGENKGDKESKFYGSLLESDIFDKRFKDEVKTDTFIERYKSVSNKDTLKQAAKELDEGGRSYVARWWAKDVQHANLIDTAVGFILMDRYQRVGDYESAIAAAEKVRAFGTASGQQVQIFSIIGRLDPNSMAVYAQKELSKAFDLLSKGRTKKWIDKNAERFNLTEEDIEFIRRRTLQAAKLPEGRDKAIRLAEICTLLQDKLPPSKGEGIKAWQRMSMLLNVKTNIRNITGNAIMVPVFITSDFFGAAIDRAVSKKTNVRTTGMFDVKSVKGFAKGAFETMDDFRRHINTRNEELNRFDVGHGKAFNEHHSGKLAKQLNDCAKVLNALDRFTSFCLELGDRPFYEMWYINSINNQMKLNKVQEATPEMIAIASVEALQRTWQDTNKVVQAVASAKSTLNGFNIEGYGLGDVLIKFTKTPANLTKAIVDFSPAGFIKTLAADGKALKNAIETGQFEASMQKKFVDNLSKGIAGTLLYVLAIVLAKSGRLSGSGDDDKDVSNFEKYIQGMPEYSIKLFGKWWSYEWLQPVGAVAATVSDYMKAKNENPDNGAYENIIEAIRAGGEVLYNQSFMTSIQTLFTADNIIDGLIEGVLSDPSVYVPQLISQAASATDDYRRITYESNEPLKTAINKVKLKIPGLRQTLEKQVDIFGRDVSNSQGNIYYAFINPANTFTDTSTPITDELYRLYKQTGDKTVMPRVAPNYFSVKGNRITFSAEGKADFQRDIGKVSADLLAELFENKEYMKLSDEQKVEATAKIYDFATAKAKSEWEYDYDLLSAMSGEKQNGDPILTKDMYKRLNQKARQHIAEEYFLSNAEIRYSDNVEKLIEYYIGQVKNETS